MSEVVAPDFTVFSYAGRFCETPFLTVRTRSASGRSRILHRGATIYLLLRDSIPRASTASRHVRWCLFSDATREMAAVVNRVVFFRGAVAPLPV